MANFTGTDGNDSIGGSDNVDLVVDRVDIDTLSSNDFNLL